MTVALDGGE